MKAALSWKYDEVANGRGESAIEGSRYTPNDVYRR